jgi:hypothetical protein
MYNIELTHLSFSRIKQLLHSPLALKRYIQGDMKQTPAMLQGSILDCLVFTPEDFNRRYMVYDKPDLRTKEGKAIAEAAKAEAVDRELITSEMFAQAEMERQAIAESPAVKHLGLLEGFEFQKRIEFTRDGLLHIGYADAYKATPDKVIIWDLKRMAAKSGETSVRYAIRDGLYHLQARIYLHEAIEAGKQFEYYIIAVSDEGYVTPFEITPESIYSAESIWNRAIATAHQLELMPETWSLGPEAYAQDIVFKF